MKLEELTAEFEITVDGAKQPSIARILWQRYRAHYGNTDQASEAADEHLSQLVGYKVHYFTIEES